MADHDLVAPLLPSHDLEAGPLPDADLHPDLDGSDNPFAFLGASPPSDTLRHAPCQVDPFRNHTPTITGVYEWLKIAVCLPVAVARLVVFGLVVVIGFVATKIALEGWKDKESPMPRWRCRIMWITRLCARCILFCFGYHWIRRIGKPMSRETAPIVVSNHVSFTDPIFFFYELFPTMVSSDSHDSMPFVGTIIRAMQVIYVDRFSPQSRRNAVREIKRRASSNGFPRVLLFPEGTTTNGRALISFKPGAFIPGLPVQPVIVRYPHVHFDQSWGTISLMKLMFRMLTQFHNFIEVEYLPVIFPPDSKMENANRFAEQTRCAMASALNVVQTSHSYGDAMLLTKASQLKTENPSAYMVELAYVSGSFDIGTLEAIAFLEKFLSMNPDACGRVKVHDFSSHLSFGSNLLGEKIFHFLDVEKQGSITFRQFLVGSAHIMAHPSFQQICEIKFNAMSHNGSGSISVQKFGDIIQSISPGTSDEKVSELLSLLDIDNDGLVNKNDFITFMRRNPLLIAVFASYPKQSALDIV